MRRGVAIITISHEMGAGGPEIGMALAQRLGSRYVDQELISDAARRYGLLEEKLTHLDESKPTLFERFDTETRRWRSVGGVRDVKPSKWRSRRSRLYPVVRRAPHPERRLGRAGIVVLKPYAELGKHGPRIAEPGPVYVIQCKRLHEGLG